LKRKNSETDRIEVKVLKHDAHLCAIIGNFMPAGKSFSAGSNVKRFVGNGFSGMSKIYRAD